MRKLLCLVALAGSFLLAPAPPAEAAQTVAARPDYPRGRYMHPHYYRHYRHGPYYRPYGYRR
jgi:hypothetical protein